MKWHQDVSRSQLNIKIQKIALQIINIWCHSCYRKKINFFCVCILKCFVQKYAKQFKLAVAYR